MRPRIAIITVTGGGEDYEFLLGSIDRHLAIGRLIVLDTTPESLARAFRLPPGVIWRHLPRFGHGQKEFKFVQALNEAVAIAESTDAEVLIQLDSDEYLDSDVTFAAMKATQSIVALKTLHHISPDHARDFDCEWHRRLWPSRRGIKFIQNKNWMNHPNYNGNPEWHPEMEIPEGIQVVRVSESMHHHLHYAVGKKSKDEATARATIPGWPEAGHVVGHGSFWPAAISDWVSSERRPTSRFQEASRSGKPTLLIVQPGRYGDIMITLPIARWYAAKGYEIVWPVPRSYYGVFRDIPYVTPRYYDRHEADILIDVYQESWKYDRVVDLSFGFTHSKAAHLWSIDRNESFIEVKYRIAGVPLEERWNLEWRSDPNRENELYELVAQGKKPYTFVHDETWCGSFPIPPASHPVVRARKIEGYTLFDWRKVLINASEILCIDSSFSNLIETIPECRQIPKSVTFRNSPAERSIYRNGWRRCPGL